MNPTGISRCQGPSRIKYILGSVIFSLLLATGCTEKSDDEPEPDTGKILIRFEHRVNDQLLQYDTLMYENEAGNPYLVNEIQYFISDVVLFGSNGSEIRIDAWKSIHYTDTDLPETQQWQVYDDIPAGRYDSVRFRFGISEEDNLSFMYPNPPERDMFWPEYLGGGYHYMKLNGKWLPEGQTQQTVPFDFHMGIGQVYFNGTDSITGFIHNDFVVTPGGESFEVSKNRTTEITLTMNIEEWFRNPNVYNHDEYGGYIMQNQEAMQKAKENGHNVFTFAVTEK